MITSPEILNSRKFRQEVLQNEQFLGNLVLVAIDELHVAQQWATFREEYGQLHKLRARIPRSVPWFGTSATLDSHTLEAAKFDQATSNGFIFLTLLFYRFTNGIY